MKKLAWALVLVAMIAGVGYAVYRLWDVLAQFPAMLGEISAAEWTLIALGAALCLGLDYLRLYTLLAVAGHRVRLWTGLAAIAVSELASIVTPTAELHIPATVYALARRDVPAPAATAAIVSKTLYMIVWVSIAGLLALVAPGAPLPERVIDYAPYCAIPLALTVVLFASLIAFARPIRRAVDARLARPLPRWRRRIYAWLGGTARDLAAIGASRRPMHFLAHLCSVGYILAYCLLGYILCDAFDLAITPARALQVFALGLVVLYIGIVPGSILVAELATAYLLDPGFAEPHHPALAVAVMLRFATRYVMLLPGAVLLITAGCTRRRGTASREGRA